MKNLVRIILSIILMYGVCSYNAFCFEKTISISTLEWEPYVGTKLDKFGFNAEIVRTAFERMGYRAEFKFSSWAQGLEETKLGISDAIFPAYYSEKRAKWGIYSAPFSQSMIVLCKRKDKPVTFKTIEDLTPYRIGIVHDFVNPDIIDKSDFLNKIVGESDEINMRKLIKGQVDLIVIDQYVAQYIAATKMIRASDTIEFINPPLDIKPLHIIFSKQDPEHERLARQFDNELHKMNQDGTLKRIKKEFGFDLGFLIQN